MALNESQHAAVGRIEVLESRCHELERLCQQLESNERLQSKFFSDLVHQIKSPVTSLILYSSLIKRGKQENKTHYIDKLHEAVRRLTEIVDVVGEYDRVKDQTDFVPINLTELLKGVVALLQPVSPNYGVLMVQLDPRPLMINGVPHLIKMMLRQVLTQALNQTVAAEITISSQLDPHVEGQGVILITNARENDRTGNKGGEGSISAPVNYATLGLGIELAKEVVRLHDGTIEIDCAIGRRTLISISFPLILK